MGFWNRADKAKGQARDKLAGAVDKHGDKVSEGIDKAAQALDDRTGGKHADKIAEGAEKAQEALEKLDGGGTDAAGDPGDTAGPDGTGR